MIKASINIPYDLVNQIMEELQSTIDKTLAVAVSIPQMLIEQAQVHNEDVNGTQMPLKQPRPKRNPTNNPDIPLQDKAIPDEMNQDRWSVEQVGQYETHVIYQPSDHHEYLAQGGRDWINSSQINPSGRALIEAKIKEVNS